MEKNDKIVKNEDEFAAKAVDENETGKKPFDSFKQGNKQQNLTHQTPPDEQMHEPEPEPPKE